MALGRGAGAGAHDQHWHLRRADDLLGVGLHDWPGGAKQTLGGIVISELQILTLPTGALRMQGLGLVGTF